MSYNQHFKTLGEARAVYPAENFKTLYAANEFFAEQVARGAKAPVVPPLPPPKASAPAQAPRACSVAEFARAGAAEQLGLVKTGVKITDRTSATRLHTPAEFERVTGKKLAGLELSIAAARERSLKKAAAQFLDMTKEERLSFAVEGGTIIEAKP